MAGFIVHNVELQYKEDSIAASCFRNITLMLFCLKFGNQFTKHLL